MKVEYAEKHSSIHWTEHWDIVCVIMLPPKKTVPPDTKQKFVPLCIHLIFPNILHNVHVNPIQQEGGDICTPKKKNTLIIPLRLKDCALTSWIFLNMS